MLLCRYYVGYLSLFDIPKTKTGEYEYSWNIECKGIKQNTSMKMRTGVLWNWKESNSAEQQSRSLVTQAYMCSYISQSCKIWCNCIWNINRIVILTNHSCLTYLECKNWVSVTAISDNIKAKKKTKSVKIMTTNNLNVGTELTPIYDVRPTSHLRI
jgi:hypothetical protein